MDRLAAKITALLQQQGTDFLTYETGLMCSWRDGQVDLYVSTANKVCIAWERRDAFGATGERTVHFILDRQTTEDDIVHAFVAVATQYRDSRPMSSPQRWGQVRGTYWTTMADELCASGTGSVSAGDTWVSLVRAEAGLEIEAEQEEDTFGVISLYRRGKERELLVDQPFRLLTRPEFVAAAMQAVVESWVTGEPAGDALLRQQPQACAMNEVVSALQARGMYVVAYEVGDAAAAFGDIYCDDHGQDAVLFLDGDRRIFELRRQRELYPTREVWWLAAWLDPSEAGGDHWSPTIPLSGHDGNEVSYLLGAMLSEAEIRAAWDPAVADGVPLDDFLAGNHVDLTYQDNEPHIPILTRTQVAESCARAIQTVERPLMRLDEAGERVVAASLVPRETLLDLRNRERATTESGVDCEGLDNVLPPPPPPTLIKSAHDAELAAAAWMSWMGFEGATATPIGPDGGVDVDAVLAVAQVKAETAPVGRPPLQNIFGVGAALRKQPIFFSLSGYTRRAVEWADEVGLPLFEFDLQGVPEPANTAAQAIMPPR